jgi:hypothetical protein
MTEKQKEQYAVFNAHSNCIGLYEDFTTMTEDLKKRYMLADIENFTIYQKTFFQLTGKLFVN